MNSLDLFILIALAGGLIVGLRSGLIKQALSFVGMLVAFVLSLHLMKPVGAMISGSLGISADLAPLIGFVLVFLAVQVGVFGLTRLLEAVIGALKLSGVNRLLGGAVGAFKAGLVLSVVFLVLGYLNVPSADTREESAFYAPISTVMPAAWDYVSEAFPQLVQVSERFGTWQTATGERLDAVEAAAETEAPATDATEATDAVPPKSATGVED